MNQCCISSRYRSNASSSVFWLRTVRIDHGRWGSEDRWSSSFSLDQADAVRILRLIFPDIIILAVATICVVIIRRTLIASRRQQANEFETSTASNQSPSPNSTTNTANRKPLWPRLLSIVRRMRLFLQFALVGFAAFVYPSIINSIYFLFFLIIAFIWSSSVKFGRKYALARGLLVIYTGSHLLVFYLYQFYFFQEVLPPLSLWSK